MCPPLPTLLGVGSQAGYNKDNRKRPLLKGLNLPRLKLWLGGGEIMPGFLLYPRARTLLIAVLDQSEEVLPDLLVEVISAESGLASPQHNTSYKSLLQSLGLPADSSRTRAAVGEMTPRILEFSLENPDLIWEICQAWLDIKRREEPQLLQSIKEHPSLQELTPEQAMEKKINEILDLCSRVGHEITPPGTGDHNYRGRHLSFLTAIIVIADYLQEGEEKTSPVPTSRGPELNPRWEKMLSEIESWSGSEKLWEQTALFLEEVNKIARKKKNSRQIAAPLEKKLQDLVLQHQVWLEFFGWPCGRFNLKDNLDQQEIKAAEDNIETLKENILEYASLQQKKPGNIQERREMRNKMGRLEDEITALLNKMKRVLQPLSAEDSTGLEVCEKSREEEYRSQPQDKEVAEKEEEEKPPPARSPEEKTEEEFRSSDEEKESAHYYQEETEEEGWYSEAEKTSAADYARGEEAPPDRDQSRIRGLALKDLQETPEKITPGEEKTWSLLARGDLPGAYWASYLLQREGEDTLPPDIIKALLASWWISTGSIRVEKEQEKISRSLKLKEEGPVRVLALAAALNASVLAPRSGLQAWLFPPEDCPELARMVESLQEFSPREIALKIEDLEGRPVPVVRKERMEELAGGIKAVLSGEKTPSSFSEDDREILQVLLQEKGELYQLLHLVAENYPGSLEKVEGLLKEWCRQPKVEKRVQAARAEVDSYVQRAEPCGNVNLIEKFILQVLENAEMWAREAHSYNQIISGEERYDEMVQILQGQISISGPGAIEEVTALQARNQDNIMMNGALLCLQWSLARLLELFEIPHKVQLPASEIEEQWWFRGVFTFDEALERRLFWVPEVFLEGATQSGNQGAEAIYNSELSREGLAQAVEKWLEWGDLRFVELMLQASPAPERERLEKRMQEERKRLMQELEREKTRSKDLLNSIYAAGFIDEKNRGKFKEKISSVGPGGVLNFRGARSYLEEIRQELEEKYREQNDELQAKEASWAWLQMGFKGQNGQAESKKNLQSILRFLGFLPLPGSRSFEVISSARRYLHVRQKMVCFDPRGLFPRLAERGENEYDVLCFWSEPGPEDMRNFMRSNQSAAPNLLILYFGNLNQEKRGQLAGDMAGSLRVAVIDQSLLLVEIRKEDNALAELTLEYLALKGKKR